MIEEKQNSQEPMLTSNDNSVQQEPLKRQAIRFNEYYNTQDIFDSLYRQSKNNQTFKYPYLINYIMSDENILLAYRNIKRNGGSYTAGVNGTTIKDWEGQSQEKYLNYVKHRLNDFHPMPVRRVEIPKPDGRMRPLGIPTIEDRLIQQCIKQVLDPICEAKFYKASYGFRPLRSTENAIAAFMFKVNHSKLYYVVDVDIKGFFDNVDHKKLNHQLWTMGIQDSQVLSIINAMLKAEIKDIGIPDKGVPQGGILSPLLSNIVLNELDWWISSQWATFPTRKKYAAPLELNGETRNSVRYTVQKKTKLKEMFIVRYADDFKILCRTQEQARKTYIAVNAWLKMRLNLDVNEEKSKITNLKHSNTEFLGFRFKAVKKGKDNKGNNKWVIKSHISDRAKDKIENELRKQIKVIQHKPSLQSVSQYNSMVRGYQNYYQIATHCTIDFGDINYKLLKCIRNRIEPLSSRDGIKSQEFNKRYQRNNKTYYVCKYALYPIDDIRHRNPMGYRPNVCIYTPKGREHIHDNLSKVDVKVIHYLMENPVQGQSIEYNDNRLSLYSAQMGKCAVSDKELNLDMQVHHVLPRQKGGNDNYSNLILVSYNIHKLIHAVKKEVINFYLSEEKLGNAEIKRLNKYRQRVGNTDLEV